MDWFLLFIIGVAVGYYLHLFLSYVMNEPKSRSTTITITRISGDEEGD